MLDYCREARDLADGRIRADLDSDRGFDLSMTRLMEMIGEARSPAHFIVGGVRKSSEDAMFRRPNGRW